MSRVHYVYCIKWKMFTTVAVCTFRRFNEYFYFYDFCEVNIDESLWKLGVLLDYSSAQNFDHSTQILLQTSKYEHRISSFIRNLETQCRVRRIYLAGCMQWCFPVTAPLVSRYNVQRVIVNSCFPQWWAACRSHHLFPAINVSRYIPCSNILTDTGDVTVGSYATCVLILMRQKSQEILPCASLFEIKISVSVTRSIKMVRLQQRCKIYFVSVCCTFWGACPQQPNEITRKSYKEHCLV